MTLQARQIVAVIRTYATRTATGEVARCPTDQKVCYPSRAVAESAALELNAVQPLEHSAHQCRHCPHFHLTTSQRTRQLTPDQQQRAAVALRLLDTPPRGIMRDELQTAMGLPVGHHRKFRRLLGGLERARLTDCEGDLTRVRAHRRAFLVQVAITGELPTH